MMNTAELPTENALVILMLCSQLGLSSDGDASVTPLTLKEWNALAHRIHDSDLEDPRRLLGLSAAEMVGRLGLAQSEAERIAGLLARGGTTALELERLAASGIWCVTLADESYPPRVRQALKRQAPAVMFGAGDLAILQGPAIAVVGSRNLDEQGEEFARRVGLASTRIGAALVSGGARGTDRIAMQAALDAGGCAVGILADSLARTIRQQDVREFVAGGRLLLLTPYRPDSGFTVGGAMGRNKIIYAAADYAVVVASDYQKGGTWAGAEEALKANRRPVFVRLGASAGSGNDKLISKGALPITEDALDPFVDIAAWMKERAGSRPEQAELLSMAGG